MARTTGAVTLSRRRVPVRGALAALGLTVPAWVLLLAMFAVPVVVGVYLAFRNESLTTFAASRFVGLENFRREILSARFLEAARVTAIVTVAGLGVQLPIGTWLAVLLHRGLRGTQVFRSALLIPMLLTPVAVGLMWRFMFSTDLGIINWMLGRFGLGPVKWLGDPWAAIAAVVIVDSWQAIPFVMLMVLAGLAGLPIEPIEAAEIDGASRWQTFRHVTAPMLRQVFLVVFMIRVIDGLKLFDTIFILTGGGPGTATQTLSLLTYRVGFTFLATSRAAALGVVLTLLTLPVYWLWRKATEAS